MNFSYILSKPLHSLINAFSPPAFNSLSMKWLKFLTFISGFVQLGGGKDHKKLYNRCQKLDLSLKIKIES